MTYHDPLKPYPGYGCDPVDTEADIIRRASSQWLRDNEAGARAYLAKGYHDLGGWFGWSDYQVNNMRAYLALVGED